MAFTKKVPSAMLATTANDQAAPLPSGHALGDLLLLWATVVITNGAILTSTDPQVYTQEAAKLNSTGSNLQSTLLYRVHDGDEGDPKVHSSQTTGNGLYAMVLGLSGVDTSAPFNGEAQDGASVAWTYVSGVTTTSGAPFGVINDTPGCLAVVFGRASTANVWELVPGFEQGFTLDAAFGSTTGVDQSLFVASKVVDTSGAVITWPSFRPTVSPSNVHMATMMIAPGASGVVPKLLLQMLQN